MNTTLVEIMYVIIFDAECSDLTLPFSVHKVLIAVELTFIAKSLS